MSRPYVAEPTVAVACAQGTFVPSRVRDVFALGDVDAPTVSGDPTRERLDLYLLQRHVLPAV